MRDDEIRMDIKRSISRITNIDLSSISDNASYKKDLMLDSLTILEIAVDAEMQFKVKIPDEELSKLENIDDTVNVIRQYLGGVTAYA